MQPPLFGPPFTSSSRVEADLAGLGYAVNIGFDIPREQQLSIQGSKDEVLGLLKTLLGGAPAG